MIGSPLRAAWRTAIVVVITLPLMIVQALLLALGAGLARALPLRYHRWCCRIFGLRVVARGKIAARGPTL